MAYTLEDFVEGVTRVKSLRTGTLGTVVKKNYEDKGEDRYDSVNIDWDNGNISYGLFVFWTDGLEIVE